MSSFALSIEQLNALKSALPAAASDKQKDEIVRATERILRTLLPLEADDNREQSLAEVRDELLAIGVSVKSLAELVRGMSYGVRIQLAVHRDGHPFLPQLEELAMRTAKAVEESPAPVKGLQRGSNYARGLAGFLAEDWEKVFARPPAASKQGNFAAYIGAVLKQIDAGMSENSIEQSIKEALHIRSTGKLPAPKSKKKSTPK